MSRYSRLTCGLGLLCPLIMAPAIVQAQLAGLLHRVPPRANAIVVLNMEKILESPLAQKENWRLQREKIHAAGLTMIPPDANQFVMAAQLDLEFMHPAWEVALLSLDSDVSTVEIAAARNGQVDRIDERNAVILPIDAYLVQFNQRTVGVMRPANRQNVANWLRQTDTTGARPDLSPYLSESVSFAEKGGTPIIMAIDLQDVISPQTIRAKLDTAESLKGQEIDLDQVSEALASIKGVTLGITVRDRIVGSIKVDFDKDVSFLEKVAKPMLLEALANNSVMIDEFTEWEPRVAANQIRLNGTLGRSGLMRLSSLFAAPPSLEKSAAPSVSGAAPDAGSLQKLASQQYFKSVAELVDDLRQKPDTTGVKTMGQVGAWYGKYARRIDELPMLNVDPELLDYGAFVASALRQGESTFRGAGGRSRVQQLNVPTQYDVVGGVRAGYGRWGAYGGYGACRLSRGPAGHAAGAYADPHRRTGQQRRDGSRRDATDRRGHGRHPPQDDPEVSGRILDGAGMRPLIEIRSAREEVRPDLFAGDSGFHGAT